MIIAFNVTVQRIADQLAAQHGVQLYSADIIYSVLDTVKDEVIKLLPKIIERRVTGEADVLQIFDIKGKGKSIINVAGCRVSNGLIERSKKVKVVRNGVTVHEGSYKLLKYSVSVHSQLACRYGCDLEDSQEGCYGSQEGSRVRVESY